MVLGLDGSSTICVPPPQMQQASLLELPDTLLVGYWARKLHQKVCFSAISLQVFPEKVPSGSWVFQLGSSTHWVVLGVSWIASIALDALINQSPNTVSTRAVNDDGNGMLFAQKLE